MDKQYILFDLDGTLTNSMMGITKSVQYALNYYGIKVNNLEELIPFIGPPLKASFQEYYNFTEEKAAKAVDKYREYFREKGLFENEVYDGIKELLKALKEKDKTLIIATSKPLIFTKQILEHFNLDGYFSDVCGATIDEKRCEKIDVMRQAIEENHIVDLSEAIMIGDRKFDIDASNELGIESIGVLYGFGSREELLKSGPTYLIDTVKDLSFLLL